jgi:hypothetical protein
MLHTSATPYRTSVYHSCMKHRSLQQSELQLSCCSCFHHLELSGDVWQSWYTGVYIVDHRRSFKTISSKWTTTSKWLSGHKPGLSANVRRSGNLNSRSKIGEMVLLVHFGPSAKGFLVHQHLFLSACCICFRITSRLQKAASSRLQFAFVPLDFRQDARLDIIRKANNLGAVCDEWRGF